MELLVRIVYDLVRKSEQEGGGGRFLSKLSALFIDSLCRASRTLCMYVCMYVLVMYTNGEAEALVVEKSRHKQRSRCYVVDRV